MSIEGIPGVMHIEDVNTALGVSGVGQLDIVPDLLDQAGDPRGGWLAPIAEAFVYADSSHGRYGASVPTLRPKQLIGKSLYFQVPSEYPEGTRVNVGLRTFDMAATVTPYVYNSEGGFVFRLDPLELRPHTYVQMPLSQLLGDHEVVAGNLLSLGFEGGVVAAYTSFTDNRSNDLRVVVDPEHRESVPVRDTVIPYPWSAP
ncbi:MAG: hypothetical protein GY842_22335, partial [bacterium]|nr:hypothetical protein [bacterium]